jgi:hypothetical protein
MLIKSVVFWVIIRLRVVMSRNVGKQLPHDAV